MKFEMKKDVLGFRKSLRELLVAQGLEAKKLHIEIFVSEYGESEKFEVNVNYDGVDLYQTVTIYPDYEKNTYEFRYMDVFLDIDCDDKAEALNTVVELLVSAYNYR